MEELLGASFDSLDALKTALDVYTRSAGFSLVTRSSGQMFKRYECKAHGTPRLRVYREGAQRVRKHAASNALGCPFFVTCAKQPNRQWNITTSHLQHQGHQPLASNAVAFPEHRRFSDLQIESINALHDAGVRATSTLESLRSNFPDILVTRRDIYNCTARRLASRLGGRSMFEALCELAEEAGWQTEIKQGTNNTIGAVFLAYMPGIEMFRKWHTVAVIDATYKTVNTADPLVHIVGMLATNQTFTMAICWVRDEREEMYRWILERWIECAQHRPKVVVSDNDRAVARALQVVLPDTAHLLCLWHLEKNVLTKVKNAQLTADLAHEFIAAWTRHARAEMLDEADCLLDKLYSDFADYPQLLDYVRERRERYGPQYMQAYTKAYPHLGNATSSRVESAHSYLKNFIRVCNGSYVAAFIRCDQALRQQTAEINAALAVSATRQAQFLDAFFFQHLLRRISIFALRQLLPRIKAAQQMVENGSFTDCPESCRNNISMGLPCVHALRDALRSRTPIPPGAVHRQWHLEPQTSVELSWPAMPTYASLCAQLIIAYNALPQARRGLARRDTEALLQRMSSSMEVPSVRQWRSTRARSAQHSIPRTLSGFERHPSDDLQPWTPSTWRGTASSE